MLNSFSISIITEYRNVLIFIKACYVKYLRIILFNILDFSFFLWKWLKIFFSQVVLSNSHCHYSILGLTNQHGRLVYQIKFYYTFVIFYVENILIIFFFLCFQELHMRYHSITFWKPMHHFYFLGIEVKDEQFSNCFINISEP